MCKALFTLAIVVISSVVVATTACASASRFLIPGLTLPPGSTETSYFKKEGLQTMEDMPGMYGSPSAMRMPWEDVVWTVEVKFENPGGWQAVSSHVDACMSKAGYSDRLTTSLKVGKFEDPSAAQKVAKEVNWRREYCGGSRTCAAVLADDKASGALAYRERAAQVSSETPSFTLTIVEYKPQPSGGSIF